VINGAQLILLQATINATLSLDFGPVWLYVGLSLLGLLMSTGLITYGFFAGRTGKKR
jgi:hypothetical protein